MQTLLKEKQPPKIVEGLLTHWSRELHGGWPRVAQQQCILMPISLGGTAQDPLGSHWDLLACTRDQVNYTQTSDLRNDQDIVQWQ